MFQDYTISSLKVASVLVTLLLFTVAQHGLAYSGYYVTVYTCNYLYDICSPTYYTYSFTSIFNILFWTQSSQTCKKLTVKFESGDKRQVKG